MGEGDGTALTTASGVLALLNEDDDRLKQYALEQLNTIVDSFWAEISESITQIEVLNESESFASRELAALVASKVYYHIGSFKSAMIYALAAGKLFDVSEDSYYTKTLVAKCIDEYVRQRASTKEAASGDVPLAGLEKIVNSVFDSAFNDAEYKYAVGIAVEARRIDRIEEAVRKSEQQAEMLDYCFRICMDVVLSRDFRLAVFRMLVRLYKELTIPEWGRIAEIFIFLEDSKSVADIICTLLQSEESFLMAYQVAFDLCSNASQEFRLDVGKEVAAKLDANTEQSRIQEYYAEMLKQTEEKERRRLAGEDGASSMEVESSTAPASTQKAEVSPDRINHMKTILSATTSTSLFLEFLHTNNHTDKAVLQNIRTSLDSRSSVVYSAIIICHGLMNSGTTSDSFLRDNFEWLSKATNWSKFTATASLGVIQKGHVKESLALLGPYLPQRDSPLSSPYSEGGALYALGLIHANHGEEITDYLKNALLNAGTNEIVQHGACLGLGVAAMATRNPDVHEHLKNVMYTDSAVAGEAAGLAMGLVNLGSASQRALEDMLAYAHETQHEKIIRGLAIGIAMIMCNRQEEADTLIQTLLLDKDPILRYGGMYTIALAYCGTADDGAIRKLLHVAVSDVSNDVRRAAVMGLGFLLLGSPEQCPKLVALLAESYNPHVRYGAALAIGISCAGTGLKVAVDMLEQLLGDGTDFVRQGALIALSMVLIQISEVQEPRVEKVRQLFADTIADKYEDVMAKFGACFATGIINAGGRNCTITPRSPITGHIDTVAVVGLAVFTQYWYWHPLAHFLSLSFTPTAVIGLNKDLKMPVFQFKSNAPPSRFAYPAKVSKLGDKAKSGAVKLESAQLSVTKKAMLRQRQKEKEKEEKKAMEVEGGSGTTTSTPTSPTPEKMDTTDSAEKEKETETEKEKEKEKEPEATHQVLQNPARVTLQQLQHITFDVDTRYIPVNPVVTRLGIVVLKDRKPDQPEEFVTPTAPPSEREEEEDEPEPPQAFEYDPAKEKD